MKKFPEGGKIGKERSGRRRYSELIDEDVEEDLEEGSIWQENKGTFHKTEKGDIYGPWGRCPYISERGKKENLADAKN